jgi:hypothetical protein
MTIAKNGTKRLQYMSERIRTLTCKKIVKSVARELQYTRSIIGLLPRTVSGHEILAFHLSGVRSIVLALLPIIISREMK